MAPIASNQRGASQAARRGGRGCDRGHGHAPDERDGITASGSESVIMRPHVAPPQTAPLLQLNAAPRQDDAAPQQVVPPLYDAAPQQVAPLSYNAAPQQVAPPFYNMAIHQVASPLYSVAPQRLPHNAARLPHEMAYYPAASLHQVAAQPPYAATLAQVTRPPPITIHPPCDAANQQAAPLHQFTSQLPTHVMIYPHGASPFPYVATQPCDHVSNDKLYQQSQDAKGGHRSSSKSRMLINEQAPKDQAPSTEEYTPMEADDDMYIAFRKKYPTTQDRSTMVERKSRRARATSRPAEGPKEFQPSRRPRCANQGKRPSQSPFSNAIRRGPLPKEIRLLKLPRYDGRTDPVKYVREYSDTMERHGYNDATQCRAFPCTLSGASRRWFDTIAPKAINNFSELATLLTQQFSNAPRKGERQGDQGRGKRVVDDSLRRAAHMVPQKRNVPLNASTDVVVKAARTQGLLPTQPAVINVATSVRASLTQHCAYHGECTHPTEECTVVRSDIGALIRQGHLLQYIDIARLLDWANAQ